MTDSNATKAPTTDNTQPAQPPVTGSIASGISRELTSVERSALEDIESAYAAFHAVIHRIEASAVRNERAAGDELETARTKLLEAAAWARRHVTG